MAILVWLALTCPSPRLIDHTGMGWGDAHGRLALANASRTCYNRYHGCPVRVIRLEPLRFRAICKRQR